MIANSQSVLTNVESLPASSSEVPWLGNELSAEPVRVGSKRILLVEDEEPLREWLRMMLELQGHQVTEAGNGAEALELFTIGTFDLVITDFQMPVMEGDKLAVAIKGQDPLLPILMITGFARARRDGQNPVDAMLTKPFKAADLDHALEKLWWTGPQSAQRSVVSEVEQRLFIEIR